MNEKCDFCGKTIGEVNRLIKPPNSDIYICDVCSKSIFNLSAGDINKKGAAKKREALVRSIKSTKRKYCLTGTPSQIHSQLDKCVIGQDNAKKILSVALYNHRKRLEDKSGLIKKSNILLIGPSGCGKTQLARTMAEVLDVPFAVIDATSLTAAGYVGKDVEVCLQRLLDASDGDDELAERGVVFIDEIDKLAGHEVGNRDIGGKSVQAALLKLIEGCVVDVSLSGVINHLNGRHVALDTTNILFVCGGAFDGLTDSQRDSGNRIGFYVNDMQAGLSGTNLVSTEVFVQYGMMPELIGRLPIICSLDALDESDLVRILTEPEDAITKEHELLFKKDGVKLVFEEEALEEIARIAIARKTGARGLRSILEDLMLDIMYQLPDRSDIEECVITVDSVKRKQPLLIKKVKKEEISGCGRSTAVADV